MSRNNGEFPIVDQKRKLGWNFQRLEPCQHILESTQRSGLSCWGGSIFHAFNIETVEFSFSEKTHIFKSFQRNQENHVKQLWLSDIYQESYNMRLRPQISYNGMLWCGLNGRNLQSWRHNRNLHFRTQTKYHIYVIL